VGPPGFASQSAESAHDSREVRLGPITEEIMSKGLETITVRVQAVRWEAERVLTFELRSPDGSPLPEFTAGAHIDLELPNGLIRSYSLCNDEAERHRYVIGVNRDANSRGGSAWLHDNLRAGQLLPVSRPRNNFPLIEDAACSVLIAGGIGITPILSMVRRLTALERAWTVHYAVRSRSQIPFLDELERLARGQPHRLRLHVDDENNGAVLDLNCAVAAGTAEDAHLYCCGPLPMLDAFEKATVDVPAERRHVEYFSAKDAPATEGGFEVELAQSGMTLTVPAGTTILDAVLDAGVNAPFSCTSGICGTCQTRVISGVPDHRDLVLTEREREANEAVMICCSGSKGSRLVLDL
jgi:ferredoxin-NADP reductase